MAAGTEAPRVRLKPILLPAEHGSWSLLAEPILLGLLIRFSPAGLLVAASSVFAFLAYRPLRIALADSRRARSVPRTRVAWTWGLGLAGVAAGMIAASVWFGGPAALGALVAAAGLLAVKAWLDLLGEARSAAAELVGTAAVGGVASAVALAGGGEGALAWLLWPVVLARAVPSVLYVRARLRLEKAEEVSVWAVLVPFLAAAVWGVWLGAGPAIIGFLLLGRAAWGLSDRRRRLAPMWIGIQEIGWGLAWIVAFGFGRS